MVLSAVANRYDRGHTARPLVSLHYRSGSDRRTRVENVIYQHPVAMCAVIGIPSEEWGDLRAPFWAGRTRAVLFIVAENEALLDNETNAKLACDRTFTTGC